MRHDRAVRIALGAIAVFMLPTALQATFAPQSFYDDFPMGRGWISASGDVYNEHLVRDVGALFLSLIIVTVWTVWKHGPYAPIAVAWLVQGALHFFYHAGHLEGLEATDKFGILVSLGLVPVLAVFVLLAIRDPRHVDDPDDAQRT